MFFLPKHAPAASWDMPHVQLSEGGKDRAWLTDGSACCK